MLVPGSVVTSGTLTAGQWNYIPLPAPVQLAPGLDPVTAVSGSTYIAAIGCNGPFPDINAFWGTRITQGPLTGYAAGQVPYTLSQGCFSTTSSDPSISMPISSSGTDNFCVDVSVSTTPPPAYSGSYRLWPNKADSNGQTVADAAVAYAVATEVDLSVNCAADYVHYYVPPGASATAGLATAADIWSISTQASVAHLASPSWTTEAGGAVTIGAAGQWVKAAFPPGISLPPGKYRVSVYNSHGASGGWSSKDAGTGYFSTGAAANGISWGPISAPSQATAQAASFYPGSGTGSTGGQPVFAYSGSDVFPNFTTGINPPQVYWVDLEVSPEPAVSASLTVTPAFRATASRGHYRASTLLISPALDGAPQVARNRAAHLTIAPSLTAAGSSSGSPPGSTSRAIVRTGIARFIGGSTYDTLFRAYRDGPLMGYGLSTVRAYAPKRMPDLDYVLGQPAGRGMGAYALVGMPETIDTPLTVGLIPSTSGGQRHLSYPVQLHVYHLAYEDHAEDAEYDVDLLDQAIHDLLYSDPTLGGICYQAGMNAAGIRTQILESEEWGEMTLTQFIVSFDVEVVIVIT